MDGKNNNLMDGLNINLANTDILKNTDIGVLRKKR